MRSVTLTDYEAGLKSSLSGTSVGEFGERLEFERPLPANAFEYTCEVDPDRVSRRDAVVAERLRAVTELFSKVLSAAVSPTALVYSQLGLTRREVAKLEVALERLLGRTLPRFLDAMLHSPSIEPRVLDVARELARFPLSGEAMGVEVIREAREASTGNVADANRTVRLFEALEVLSSLDRGTERDVMGLIARTAGLSDRNLIETTQELLPQFPAFADDLGGTLIVASSPRSVTISRYAMSVIARSSRLGLFDWCIRAVQWRTAMQRAGSPS